VQALAQAYRELRETIEVEESVNGQ
jgi:hypothetical protein